MDFFKSVFSDDPDPPPTGTGSSTSERQRSSESLDSDPNDTTNERDPSPDPEPAFEPSGAWSRFGGLIKTLTVKSESVIETYRRDLQEFGTGLKKEIEVAQGSLETVGQAIDEIGSTVVKGTTQIISQGKEAILAADSESDSSDGNNQSKSLNSKRYSRFDAQVRAIQGDVNTYCGEPDDLEDYRKWKSGFDLNEKSEELEGLLEENGAMESIYKRVVPSSVDHETFWCRYLYKVHKLKQAEELRVKLVHKAIVTEEEELSWDVDDSEDEKEKDGKSSVVPKESSEMGKKASGDAVKDDDKSQIHDQNVKGNSTCEETKEMVSVGDSSKNKEMVSVGDSSKDKEMVPVADSSKNKEMVSVDDSSKKNELGEKNSDEVAKDNVDDGSKKGSTRDVDGKGKIVDSEADRSKGEKAHSTKSKPDEKNVMASKGSSDFSVVSSQPAMPEEEDLGWDEIEDLSNIDDHNKSTTATRSGSPNRADLCKRLSTPEEEEDLSWDIEDDD